MPTSRVGQCWFLLPVALVLLAGGCAALILLGLPAVRQYATERHFRSSECRVIAVRYTGNRSCEATSSSTFYPCFLVVAIYDDDDDVDATEVNESDGSGNFSGSRVLDRAAVLYRATADAEDSRTTVDVDDKMAQNSTCSVRACSRSSTVENAADVLGFLAAIGVTSASSPPFSSSSGTDAEKTPVSLPIRRCYVDPTGWDSSGVQADEQISEWTLPRRRKAFVDVVTGDRVVHTLWWPSLAIGAGIILCVVAVFQLCFEARLCHRQRSSGDEERRRKQRRLTSTDLPEVIGGAKPSIAGISYSGSACSTCERATLTTGTSSSSSGTNSSRRSKSMRSSASNKSLLPLSATSTSRSTKSSAAATEKNCPRCCEEHGNGKYASNTV